MHVCVCVCISNACAILRYFHKLKSSKRSKNSAVLHIVTITISHKGDITTLDILFQVLAFRDDCLNLASIKTVSFVHSAWKVLSQFLCLFKKYLQYFMLILQDNCTLSKLLQFKHDLVFNHREKFCGVDDLLFLYAHRVIHYPGL